MKLVQHSLCQGSVCCTEVGGEVEHRSLAVAHAAHDGAIVGDVQADVWHRNVEECSVVNFVVGPRRVGLGVIQDCLDEFDALHLVCSCCSDGVVGAVQFYGTLRTSTPGEIAVIADDAHHLIVCVRDCEEYFIRAGHVSVIAGSWNICDVVVLCQCERYRCQCGRIPDERSHVEGGPVAKSTVRETEKRKVEGS